MHRIFAFNLSALAIVCISLVTPACSNAQESVADTNVVTEQPYHIIDTSGRTLQTRINPPAGYVRVKGGQNDFSTYLRNLPLHPAGTSVKYYDGSIKPNPNIYVAVVNQKIGDKDLHQCADAVMHLRADYLWQTKQYERIHFNLTNGFRMDYVNWMNGNRLRVNGNSTSWIPSAAASNTEADLWNYLEKVFTFAGTLSLSRELQSIPLDSMQIGDVFLYGGSPGHAEIVVDMAIDTTTGKKVFLLAQSFMPAQETQILTNQNEPDVSPWYSLDFTGTLQTPEYWFNDSQLMRFPD